MAARTVGRIARGDYSERNIPLRRPHGHNSSPAQNFSPKTLIQKLKSINCDKQEDDEFDKCIEMFNKLSPTEDDSVTVIRHLHTACLVDDSVSRQVAMFLAKLIQHKADERHFIRTQWLLLLQEDYEGRQTLNTSAHDTFLNAVCSHGEVYNSLLVGSVPLKVLAPPLVEYLKMILNSGSREDLNVLLLQLVVNGKNLKDQGGVAYEELLVEIRKVLLSSSLPQLVLATDITAGNFPHPKGALHDFYEAQMKDEYLALECRALGVPIQAAATSLVSPVAVVAQDLSEKLSVAVDSTWQLPVPGSVPDVNVVRERMRAKGLLGARLSGPATQLPKDAGAQKEKDDEFYGVQLPRTKSSDAKASGVRQAMSVPLPSNDDWD